ncbi:MAG: protein kinase, partial [Deltaproteobacteria bacterium]|nr:protein kinase [Kofleriaceae bacterium]
MTGRSQGDDAPGDSGARAAAPARAVVRSEPGTAGESHVMGAADTAVAMAASGEHAHTEPSVSASSVLTSPVTREDLVGTMLLGRYSVTRKIGQGGMGAVYEATHTLIGKRVAVKVLLDKYARKEQVVARLEQEARLASSIGHEHIIDITDFGTTEDGRTFVVMEFLEGESLAELLAREGPLPEARIVDIAFQVASALGAAHDKGIVHRDVKPENVFLLRRKDRDFAKVVDFGISKSLRSSDAGEDDSPRLTQTGMVLGTPLYMSPEQARGDEDLDHRIDIYALGVIMYELATGRVPFTGTNYLSIISQVLNDTPKPPRTYRPELSDELEAVILKALEKDREQRYQSTAEMLADLSVLADDPTHSTQRARITGPRRYAPKKGGLRAVAWIAVIAGIIAAVALTVTATMSGGAKAKDAQALAAIDAGAPPPPAIDAGVVQPQVTTVKIRVETIPPGALIFEGSRELGQSPIEPLFPLTSETVKLVATLEGYDDAECNIRPATDRGQTVKCTLKKVKKGQQRKIIKRPTGGDPDADGKGG